MTKSELVECVALAYPGLYHRDAELAVDAILDTVADALASGNRVEIRGFGVFSARKRRSRLGRNPRTGHRVPVAAKRVQEAPQRGHHLQEYLAARAARQAAKTGTS